MRPSGLCLSSPKAPAFASHYKSPLLWMPCGVLVAQVQPMRPPVRKNVNASLGSVWGPGRATTAPTKLPRAPTRESDKGRWLEVLERARVVRRLASGGGKEGGCADFWLFGVMSLTLNSHKLTNSTLKSATLQFCYLPHTPPAGPKPASRGGGGGGRGAATPPTHWEYVPGFSHPSCLPRCRPRARARARAVRRGAARSRCRAHVGRTSLRWNCS